MGRFNQALTFISGFLMLSFTFFANTQVLYRYILQLPLPWIEELARYVMILMVFIMSGVAIYQRSHLIVEIFDALLKPKSLFYLHKIRSATAIVFSLCFTLLTLKYFIGVVETGQVSPALRISMSIPLSALLIGGVILTINSVYMLFFWRPLEQSSELRKSL